MARKAGPSMQDVLDALDELSEAAGDLRPVWRDLGMKYEFHMDDVFASDGGGTWNSFASATLLKKDRQGPLVDEGVMKEGLTLRKPRYDDTKMVAFGPPKRDYRVQNVAILNHVGHRDRAGNMVPPRRIKIPLNAQERQQWIDVIRKHLREAWG